MNEEKRAALEVIEKRDGEILASTLVTEAKKRKHPFHEDIWGIPEETLAHQQRLQIARREIRKFYEYTITTVGEKETEVKTPMFIAKPVSQVIGRERGYVSRKFKPKEMAKQEITDLIKYTNRTFAALVRLGYHDEAEEINKMLKKLERLFATFD